MRFNFFTLEIAELYSVIFVIYNSINPLFSVWLSDLLDPILFQYARNFFRIESDFFQPSQHWKPLSDCADV